MSFIRKKQILAGLVGLFLLLPACRSLRGGGTEPPLPTIVPDMAAEAATSETEEVLPTLEVAEGGDTPTVTGPLPTPTEIPEPVLAVSPTAAAAVVPAETATEPRPPAIEQPTPAVPDSEESQPAEPVSPTAPATASQPLEAVSLNLSPVAGGFTKPLFLTHAGDGSGRLFVVEQAGRILIVEAGQVNPTPFLDIVDIVNSQASEQGLLSVAFHPDYASNGLFFVDYTDLQGNTVVARYRVSEDPNRADPGSAQILLTINQPYANHNGGLVLFGPDGYLYVGTGDGGSANDPQNNGQSLNTLLGKILRLEVDNAAPYGAPESNPFVGREEARPEIWSYGWRNPWRFSFDRATGDMYIADVGQNQYEEVHVEPAGAEGGRNYGWRLMEGRHCFDPPECDPAELGLVLPVVEYDHSQGCSVTGGYVYRGEQFPALNGIYFYGDFCSGLIWGLRQEGEDRWSQVKLLESGLTISSFGQDEAGELYVIDHRGDVYQLGSN